MTPEDFAHQMGLEFNSMERAVGSEGAQAWIAVHQSIAAQNNAMAGLHEAHRASELSAAKREEAKALIYNGVAIVTAVLATVAIISIPAAVYAIYRFVF